MDDTLLSLGATMDAKTQSVALTKTSDKNWKGNFAYQRPAPDKLILDGEMGGHKMHMEMQLVDRNKFLLVNRGFHWVQEYPFNR